MRKGIKLVLERKSEKETIRCFKQEQKKGICLGVWKWVSGAGKRETHHGVNIAKYSIY